MILMLGKREEKESGNYIYRLKLVYYFMEEKDDELFLIKNYCLNYRFFS